MARLNVYLNNLAGYAYTQEEIDDIIEDMGELTALLPTDADSDAEATTALESMGSEKAIGTLNRINARWDLGVETFVEYGLALEADDNKPNFLVRIWQAIVRGVKALMAKIRGWFGATTEKVAKATTDLKTDITESTKQLESSTQAAKKAGQSPTPKGDAPVVKKAKAKLKRVKVSTEDFSASDTISASEHIPMAKDFITLLVPAGCLETVSGRFIAKEEITLKELSVQNAFMSSKLVVDFADGIRAFRAMEGKVLQGGPIDSDAAESILAKDRQFLESLYEKKELIGHNKDEIGVAWGLSVWRIRRASDRGDMLCVGVRPKGYLPPNISVYVTAERSGYLDLANDIVKSATASQDNLTKAQRNLDEALAVIESAGESAHRALSRSTQPYALAGNRVFSNIVGVELKLLQQHAYALSTCLSVTGQVLSAAATMVNKVNS